MRQIAAFFQNFDAQCIDKNKFHTPPLFLNNISPYILCVYIIYNIYITSICHTPCIFKQWPPPNKKRSLPTLEGKVAPMNKMLAGHNTVSSILDF